MLIEKDGKSRKSSDSAWEPRFPIAEWPGSKTERSQKESVMEEKTKDPRVKTETGKSPKILKGGGAMFRKLLNLVMFAALLITASSLLKPVYAQGFCERVNRIYMCHEY